MQKPAADIPSPRELSAQLAAERRGFPFLVYRDGDGTQRILSLDRPERLTIGRREANDLSLDWDDNVSRVHAELEYLAGEWTLADESLSRNGSYLNGARVSGRRRLANGDVIRVGDTILLYRAPALSAASTVAARSERPAPPLSDAQRRVLVALCRPCVESGLLEPPASNREIAAELHVSVPAVKAQLRVLFTKFAIGELPHNRKRLELVAEAIRRGSVRG